MPVDAPGVDRLFSFWGEYETLGSQDWRFAAFLYTVIPVVLFGGPTFVMGLSFPVLQRAVQDDVATTGLKVGILQSGNIAGNVAGSLFTGLLLLGIVGTTGTMRWLLVLGLLFPVLGIVEYGWRSPFPAAGALLLSLVVMVPAQDRFWKRLHGMTSGPALFAEDATGLTAITPEPDTKLRLSINGKGQSWIPFGGPHSLLGREVAIIGLGSGDTAWAAAFRDETESVTVFEINAGQPGLLRQVAEAAPYPDLVHLLDDPRIHVVLADGRTALAASDARYDLIEADALRPGSAYAGNLYSLEFFALCAARLKPGGLMMCTWAPTPRVYVTFCEVFPHVLAVGEILVGSRDPIPREVATWLERAGSERAVAYLGPTVATSLAETLPSAFAAEPELYLRVGWNRDLFPRDEFSSP